LTGEAYAIACAFLWALSSTLLKSQTDKMGVIPLAAWRTVPGLFIYLGLLFFSGQANEIMHLPFRSLAFLIGSTLIGLGLGDLLYFRSMKLIGLARAMPISSTYPFFTLVLALLFLAEQFAWTIVGGAVLISVGTYLLAFPRGSGRVEGATTQGMEFTGVALALASAACWAAGTVMLRLGLEGASIVVANSIRMPLLVTVLFAILFQRREIGQVREYGLRSLGITLLAGTIGTGLGTFTFLAALQRVGAAKTSILTSATPLFGVPFSLILGEKLTPRTVVGTFLTVAGVWLTV